MKKNKILVIDIILGCIGLVLLVLGVLKKIIDPLLSWNLLAILAAVAIIWHYYLWKTAQNKAKQPPGAQMKAPKKSYKDSIYGKKK